LLLRCPESPLFPYTTLFRSWSVLGPAALVAAVAAAAGAAAVAWIDKDLFVPIVMVVLVAVAVFVTTRPKLGAGGTRRPSTLRMRSEEHTSELQSRENLVCRR